MKDVCLVPAGTESDRRPDPVGYQIAIDHGQLTTLPPIRTVIRDRSEDSEQVHVSVNYRVTEIGTLDL